MADDIENPEPQAAESGLWPELDGTTQDPAVDRIVRSVQELAAMPTQDHADLYDGLADQLSQELDSDPATDINAGGRA